MYRTSFFVRLLLMALMLTSLAAIALGQRAPARTTDLDRLQLPSDQRPGSVLVYNFYTSKIGDPAEDTIFTITNTNPNASVNVRFFFVSKTGVTLTFYDLVGPQTLAHRVSDENPGDTGYIIAIATDSRTGQPISFNHLVGSAMVKLASGFKALLPTENFRALYQGVLPNSNGATATVAFDGVQYSLAPRAIGVDAIFPSVQGNQVLLAVNSLDGDLSNAMQPLNAVAGEFTDTGSRLPFTIESVNSPQYLATYPQQAPRLVPRYHQSRQISLKIGASIDRAVVGSFIFFSSNTTDSFALNGGRNMHHISYTTARLIVPIIIPI